ncbi:hypothetical protein T440DRAFT_260021 [Plenodomus tracheiphilus IPT5]|uniref:Alpha/beta-hydrolase n=1 Tax=Plenodomus tracheiphilus IPT5 TaxID=1408161 RepID=A0A6A7AR07_9PLEO|nr:hypothetical protein T440DRAFT_260021 [Plenodomus tracheiphilus IPT5]
MEETAKASATPHTRRQNALAEIQFASIADGDLTPSEDETAEEQHLELETVQSAIGVSIGEQQTRLNSAKTPAAEKAAALDETDGGGLFDSWDHSPDVVPETNTRQSPSIRPDTHTSTTENARKNATTRRSRSHDRSNAIPMRETKTRERLPSPWRAGPKTFTEKVSDHRAVLRHHLQGGRRRASSGGSMAETMRKYMPSLPSSISKSYKDLHFSLPSFSALSLEPERGRPAPTADGRRRRDTFANGTVLSSIPQQDGGSHTTLPRDNHVVDGSVSHQQPRTTPLPQREFNDDSNNTVVVALPDEPRERPPRLRRSTSEGSLMLYRTRSLASSLGDDSRFESVNSQVNSRMKAIKDSWQDSNFKLPSPSFPNFNFGTREDLFKIRNGSITPRSKHHDDGATHRVGLLSSVPASTSSSRDTSVRRKRPSTSAGIPEAEAHPFFTKALQELEGDVVVLGGYRGSILRSAEPPNRQLWVPIKVGLNLRKVDLEVPLDADADERMEKTIYPSGMLTHIGPVDISRRLFKRLKASDNARAGRLRVHNYGYDWRLSPHFLSRRMIQYLESLPCNQPGVPREKRGAWVIAHSLGGLITRHAINQRPDLVAGVVYAGVPQHCVNILGPFHKGDDVMLSSRVLTAQVNFSIRTSYALLPLDGKCFFNKNTKEEYPVDFFDVNTWKEHRLSPCIAAPLPRPDQPKDTFSVSGLMNAMSQALPTIPRKGSFSLSKSFSMNNNNTAPSSTSDAKGIADTARNTVSKVGESAAGMEPQMSQGQTQTETSTEQTPATHVTIPYDKAVEYLARVLAETKTFKQELAHRPEHTESNAYPPISLIYGKSTPTVYGAKVESKEVIKRADVYDELAFASGDGVVLARAAMAPEGYSVVRGGVVASERGHVTLLGDLEAVGRCLCGVIKARKAGVGLGVIETRPAEERKVEGPGVDLNAQRRAVAV